MQFLSQHLWHPLPPPLPLFLPSIFPSLLLITTQSKKRLCHHSDLPHTLSPSQNLLATKKFSNFIWKSLASPMLYWWTTGWSFSQIPDDCPVEEHGTQNPASCGKIAKNDDLDISDMHACRSNTKHVIWLARKTVIFHSWHDRFEYYYARIWFGRNYFRVKLIPPIKKIE